MLRAKTDSHHSGTLTTFESSAPDLMYNTPDSSPTLGPMTQTMDPTKTKRVKLDALDSKKQETLNQGTFQLESTNFDSKNTGLSESQNASEKTCAISPPPPLRFYPRCRQQYTASCDSTDNSPFKRQYTASCDSSDSGPSPYRSSYSYS